MELLETTIESGWPVHARYLKKVQCGKVPYMDNGEGKGKSDRLLLSQQLHTTSGQRGRVLAAQPLYLGT